MLHRFSSYVSMILFLSQIVSDSNPTSSQTHSLLSYFKQSPHSICHLLTFQYIVKMLEFQYVCLLIVYLWIHIMHMCVPASKTFSFDFQTSGFAHVQRHAYGTEIVGRISPPWYVTMRKMAIRLRSVLWFLVCLYTFPGIVKVQVRRIWVAILILDCS